MFSAGRLRAGATALEFPAVIPHERNRCHVDYQYGSAGTASRPVRHRPRRVISHVRDQAHVRVGKVRGRLKVTRGVITIADPPEDSRVEAEVSASSFSTRNFMRDPQVRSRLFPTSAIIRRSRSVPTASGSTGEAGRLPGSSP